MKPARDVIRLRWLLLVVFLTPLLLLVAVFGTRLGVWSAEFGLGTLALEVGRVLAFVGGAAALIGAVLAVRAPRRLGGLAALGLVVAGAVLAGVLVQGARFSPEPRDVTTDSAEPPAFSRAVTAERRAAQAPAATPERCDGLAFAPTQVTPETASRALTEAGFTVLGSAPFRADGRREGAWFGLTHDAAVRIRPGRTDVRVASRNGVDLGDEACRLARAVVAGLAG